MKTKQNKTKQNKIRNWSVLAILLLAGLFSENLNAQMSMNTYTIQNTRTCPVTVHYEVSDNACFQSQCFTTVSSPLVLGPSSQYVLTNAPCAFPGYDIFVWVLEINGVDVTGGGSNANSVSASSGACLWSGSGNSFTGPIPPAAVCGSSSYGVNCGPLKTIIY